MYDSRWFHDYKLFYIEQITLCMPVNDNYSLSQSFIQMQQQSSNL